MSKRNRISQYIVQLSHDAICPLCGKHLQLLCDRNGSTHKPWFYICWLCRNIAQVGVGPVTEER